VEVVVKIAGAQEVKSRKQRGKRKKEKGKRRKEKGNRETRRREGRRGLGMAGYRAEL
jgi:hypothetical protein